MLKKTITSFLNRKAQALRDAGIDEVTQPQTTDATQTQAATNERELMETAPTPATTPGIEITFAEAQALAQAARSRLGVSAVFVHPITGDVKASHNGRDWFDVATSDLITKEPATDDTAQNTTEHPHGEAGPDAEQVAAEAEENDDAEDEEEDEEGEDEELDYVENADGTITSHGFTFPTLRAYHTARNTLPEDVTQLDDGRYLSHGFTFDTLKDYYTARGL